MKNGKIIPNVRTADIMMDGVEQSKCLMELNKQFYKTKSVKRLKIITKTRRTIDFEK